MEESLLPREIPAGGVGTCRLDFSDIGIDSGDRAGCEGGAMGEMGDDGGRGRKGAVVYMRCRCAEKSKR